LRRMPIETFVKIGKVCYFRMNMRSNIGKLRMAGHILKNLTIWRGFFYFIRQNTYSNNIKRNIIPTPKPIVRNWMIMFLNLVSWCSSGTRSDPAI